MNDELEKQKIRELIAAWMKASRAGDTETVLKLMAEDVVFLRAGQPPMKGRQAFAAAARAMEGKMLFEGEPEIQDIQIAGNFAFGWIHLSVKVTPLSGSPPAKLAGHILSVYRKEPDGRWVLLRDANMLAPVAQAVI